MLCIALRTFYMVDRYISSEAALIGPEIVYSSREFESVVRLEIKLIDSVMLLKIKEIMVPGRGLELANFLLQIQCVRKSRELFTRQITRCRLLA